MTHITRSGATIGDMPGDVARYAIRVRGRLSDAVLSAFDGMTSDVAGGDTVLRGPVADQVELHRLLDRIRSLGLELVELRRTPPVESST